MTTTPTTPTAPETVSGADLARLALQSARAAARARGNNPSESRTPRSRPARSVRGDRREPAAFGAVTKELIADRVWELATLGASVLDQWPDIAALVAPTLADRVKASGYDPTTGALTLWPETMAYRTQLRYLTNRILAAARQVTGTSAVRSIVVLAPHAPPPPAPGRRQAAPEPSGEVKTREMGCAGYQEALAVVQGSRSGRRVDPEVAAAVERQTKAMRELSARAFAAQADAPAPIAEARLQRSRQAAAVEAAALRRARAERAARQNGTTTSLPQQAPLRTTA
ncbi:DciA family protein [Streptomyces sp. NBC_00237]|uniref:DciA family protein n=1 Tax=Streptomyces sp. NBC_00237 TaxID=2975687 RepID=UPI0022538C12|nr:DciA family protein [Streptomyces sp. NBC_00237]MCX5207575.1 DciA family protein [Streptomyces sp. NBC_00237]